MAVQDVPAFVWPLSTTEYDDFLRNALPHKSPLFYIDVLTTIKWGNFGRISSTTIHLPTFCTCVLTKTSASITLQAWNIVSNLCVTWYLTLIAITHARTSVKSYPRLQGGFGHLTKSRKYPIEILIAMKHYFSSFWKFQIYQMK